MLKHNIPLILQNSLIINIQNNQWLWLIRIKANRKLKSDVLEDLNSLWYRKKQAIWIRMIENWRMIRLVVIQKHGYWNLTITWGSNIEWYPLWGRFLETTEVRIPNTSNVRILVTITIPSCWSLRVGFEIQMKWGFLINQKTLLGCLSLSEDS